mmetsp:Transcript_36541/g.97637  ORF Transcript_36541/g.97637 Transcript_36541/m.97637 type:complete len:438 (+) Transcript_36541:711-2024(+)
MAYCEVKGMTDRGLKEFEEDMKRQAKEAQLEQMRQVAKQYSTKKDKSMRKKKKEKVVIYEEPPPTDFDDCGGLIELDCTGLELNEKGEEAAKRQKAPHHVAKTSGKRDRSHLQRGGAPDAGIGEEWAKIMAEKKDKAKIRAQQEMDLGLLAGGDDEEEEVEVIPWVADTWAERKRVEANQAVKALESQLIAERDETIQKRMKKYGWKRRVLRGLGIWANLKAVHATEVMGFFTSNPARVLPWLYYGSADAAHDLEKLKGLGVTHVINATKGIEFHHPGHFIYIRLRIDDDEEMGEDQFMMAMRGAAKLIDTIENKGGVVFVHCNMGLSRAPMIIMAYLMLILGRTLQDSWNMVRSVRPEVHPNATFMYNIAVLELRERGATSVHRDAGFREGRYNELKNQPGIGRVGHKGQLLTYHRFWLTSRYREHGAKGRFNGGV